MNATAPSPNGPNGGRDTTGRFALGNEGGPGNPQAGKVAKLLAKTFYHEMSMAGFGPDHMITTATEIISLLSEKLQKHRDRMDRQ